jgi:hypothetical protein
MLPELNATPPELFYVFLAVMGGVARYLYGFINGQQFDIRIFGASAIVAGFSGYIFLLLGIHMEVSIPMQGIMSGLGGFFGDQTMKLVLEMWKNKFLPFDNNR